VAEPADRDTAGRQHSRHLGENANHHSFLPFPFLDPVLHQELFKAKHVICLAVGYIDGVSVSQALFGTQKLQSFLIQSNLHHHQPWNGKLVCCYRDIPVVKCNIC
jgi:hypothetical protein